MGWRASRRTVTTLCAVSLGGAVVAASNPVRAYTIASAISSGCHERITTDALRAVRQDLTTAAPLAASSNEQALIDDLEFPVPADLNDLGGATLLIGVRDNDLKGHASNDITQLAMVHGDPQLQREHCLRGVADDEPDGSANALAACRAFILERTAQALQGLDAGGAPDPTNRTVLPVYLALRHGVDAPLPTYYVRIGQAIHAVEDSFTHTYRSADGLQITVALNWVDAAGGTLVAARDGPPHAGELDHCDDPDDLRRQRRLLATEAATAMLRVTLDPQSDAAQKMTGVAAVLDQYLGYAPGCTFDNGWCDAPERKYGNGSFACAVGGGDTPTPVAACAVLLGLWLLTARRPRRAGRAALTLVAIFSLVSALAGRAAAAQPAPTDDATDAQKPALRWGGYVGGSASMNYGGLATAAGARLRIGKHLIVGADAEWNPWFAINGASKIRAGAFNAYATAILRVPLAAERFDLRTTFDLGTSVLLIDLYGAPRGSTGLFFGFDPLGVEWALSRHVHLILDPLGYALPVPQLHGVPLAFPQYRVTLGLELYGG
jgi:hypothetical protein